MSYCYLIERQVARQMSLDLFKYNETWDIVYLTHDETVGFYIPIAN